MECDAYWDYSGWYVALSADGSRVAISAINHGNPPGAGAGKRGNIKKFKGASPPDIRLMNSTATLHTASRNMVFEVELFDY